MKHVVLLGDSIFDNAAYTGGGPSVSDHLIDALPGDWRTTLLARDGATIVDVVGQVRDMPSDATLAVVSMGGNDALNASAILNESVRTVADALLKLAEPLNRFERAYLDAVMVVLARDLPAVLCTIYNGAFQPGPEQTAISTALRLFNDCIIRIARQAHLGVIELRDICVEPADYANPIEPSSAGGAKIAAAITGLIT